MTAGLLPALVFLAMAALAFATGSSWGIYVVTIPIVSKRPANTPF